MTVLMLVHIIHKYYWTSKKMYVHLIEIKLFFDFIESLTQNIQFPLMITLQLLIISS